MRILHKSLQLFRLQNSRNFCERGRRSICERKMWSEFKNSQQEWGETLKNTTVRHADIKFVQNYLFFQQWEIPIGLIPMQPVIKCHSHLIKKIQMPYQFHSKDSTSHGKWTTLTWMHLRAIQQQSTCKNYHFTFSMNSQLTKYIGIKYSLTFMTEDGQVGSMAICMHE